MSYVDRIIDEKFGGLSKAARALGMKKTTVHYWRTVGHIPAHRHPEVRERARKACVRLEPSDFFDQPLKPSSALPGQLPLPLAAEKDRAA